MTAERSRLFPATIGMAMRHSQAVLSAPSSIVRSETPKLDAEVLLAWILGWSREQLFARTDELLPSRCWRELYALLMRRVDGEPVAYLTCTKEFMGLTFVVGPGVLIPRVDTECIVEHVLTLLPDDGRSQVVADVGAGSGAIGISLASYRPLLRVCALESEFGAVDIATKNARNHQMEERVTVIHGDLLAGLSQPADIIVANLPYIPSLLLPSLPRCIRDYEPISALDGGSDGLALYRRMLGQLSSKPDLLNRTGFLVCECDSSQVNALSTLVCTVLPERLIEVITALDGRPIGIQVSPGG